MISFYIWLDGGYSLSDSSSYISYSELYAKPKYWVTFGGKYKLSESAHYNAYFISIL